MKNNRNDTPFLSLNYEDEGCGGGLGSRFPFFANFAHVLFNSNKHTLRIVLQ